MFPLTGVALRGYEPNRLEGWEIWWKLPPPFGGRGKREMETSYKTGMTRNKHVKQKSPAIAQKQSTTLRSLMPKKGNSLDHVTGPKKLIITIQRPVLTLPCGFEYVQRTFYGWVTRVMCWVQNKPKKVCFNFRFLVQQKKESKK